MATNQIDDLSNEDVEESLRLLKDIPALCSSISETVQNVIQKVKDHNLSTNKGIGFLDLKNQNLLNYLTNLTYLIQQKLSGKKIENSKAVERLAELRIVLEKMRPIDEKLKYQINKLQTAATHGKIDTSDPLRFRANPENLDVQEESGGEEKKESNVYVPPKISAAYFDEDESLEARKKKLTERSQKRALSSSVLYELRKEYETGPEEIKETVDAYKLKLSEERRDRQRYEEEYMTRLPMTKRQKHESRQMMTVHNFSAGLDDSFGMNTESVHPKRKSSGKKGKFFKKGGKFRGKKRKQ